MTEVTHVQAKKLAGLYCGGLSPEYSFTQAGLMLMLNHCLDLATPAPAQPEGAPWWRKRADEIERQVACNESNAMRCYTDMRALLQAVDREAGAAAPAEGAATDTQRLGWLFEQDWFQREAAFYLGLPESETIAEFSRDAEAAIDLRLPAALKEKP